MASAFLILAGLIIGALVLAALLFVLIKVLGGIAYAIGAVTKHVFGFIFGMLQDAFRLLGAGIAGIIFSILIGLNVLVGRWSGAKHFGEAMHTEVKTFGGCVYRILIGRPLKFLLLGGMVEGIEQRVPRAIEAAPGSDKPSRKTGSFDGYKIVGSLKGGGSGGRLYVAEPDAAKAVSLERQGFEDIDQVVIKSFSLRDGSSLPQIIRESRALEAARKLGLILEHEHSADRFFYVMRYVPGDTLTTVTTRLHADTGQKGLGVHELRQVCTYTAQLLQTLEVYHSGGLWHKDIKPDNIIVHDGEAHVVDLGLVTPLRSAMTLTTHGTEYFRDPELVRMALRGAKVHEVDGVKFDIYGAGAVLYSMVEDSFPAHGALSTVTKQCPDALRWVIRRAMAETNQRYASAQEMLHDLQAVIAASDPFAMKPKDLPSMGGAEVVPEQVAAQAVEDAEVIAAAFAPASVGGRRERTVDPERMAGHGDGSAVGKPKIRVVDWLTGGFVASKGEVERSDPNDVTPPAEVKAVRPVSFRTAAEQRERAKARAHAARERAKQRMGERRGGKRATAKNGRYSNNPTAGVFFGLLLFGAVLAGIGVLALSFNVSAAHSKAEYAALSQPLGNPSANADIRTSSGIGQMRAYWHEPEIISPLPSIADKRFIYVSNATPDRSKKPASENELTLGQQASIISGGVLNRLRGSGVTLVGGKSTETIVRLAELDIDLQQLFRDASVDTRDRVRRLLASGEIDADAIVAIQPGSERLPVSIDVIGGTDTIETAILQVLQRSPDDLEKVIELPGNASDPTPPATPALPAS